MNRYFSAFSRLSNATKSICKKEGGNSFFLVLDAFWCFVRYGMTPNEYWGWNVWRLSARERNKYYTARHSKRYEKLYNPRQYAHFFDNKKDFNEKFKSFVKRDWVFATDLTTSDVADFIKQHEKVVVKPIGLSSGLGIFTTNYEQFKSDGGVFLLVSICWKVL